MVLTMLERLEITLEEQAEEAGGVIQRACARLAQEHNALEDHAQLWHDQAMKWRAAHAELANLLTSSGPDPRVVKLDAQCRKLAQENARLQKDVAAQRYLAGHDAARALRAETLAIRRKAALKQVEWGTWDYTFPRCPWCDALKAEGHIPTCGLAAALAEEQS